MIPCLNKKGLYSNNDLQAWKKTEIAEQLNLLSTKVTMKTLTDMIVKLLKNLLDIIIIFLKKVLTNKIKVL